MNAIKNKVQLIGNIGQTPELKELDGGKKVINFSLATNEVYTNAAGEKVTNTAWHNVVAWGKTAEHLQKFAKKGSQLAIEGKLTYRSYDNKDGQTITTTEILVNEFLAMGKNEN